MSAMVNKGSEYAPSVNLLGVGTNRRTNADGTVVTCLSFVFEPPDDPRWASVDVELVLPDGSSGGVVTAASKSPIDVTIPLPAGRSALYLVSRNFRGQRNTRMVMTPCWLVDTPALPDLFGFGALPEPTWGLPFVPGADPTFQPLPDLSFMPDSLPDWDAAIHSGSNWKGEVNTPRVAPKRERAPAAPIERRAVRKFRFDE